MKENTPRRLLAEAIGTAILLATVVGSGIMGETMAGGNDAIALLGNTIATGAILVVLILIFGPVSGAHYNPAVTLVFLLRREIGPAEAALFVVVQVIGGICGVLLAHGMFDVDLVSEFTRPRTGGSQWLSEAVATFGLLITILGCVRFRAEAVPYAVGLYITAGYWFTASTSFANPAVTIARSFTGTFAGINPADAPGFIIAQLVGAVLAFAVGLILFREGE
jgi:glycerol uptake facilitator-like aquaporin